MTEDELAIKVGSLLFDVRRLAYRAGNGKTASLAQLIEDRAIFRNPAFNSSAGKQIVAILRESCSVAEAPNGGQAERICSFANSIVFGRKGTEDAFDEDLAAKDAGLKNIFSLMSDVDEIASSEHSNYCSVIDELANWLEENDLNDETPRLLRSFLGKVAGSVPASTNQEGLVDVSFYEAAKLRCALSTCVFEYLTAKGEDLAGLGIEAWHREMFLLLSCDLSGIQDFIYNISGAGALKQLRARSLYLEILLEHCIDELLERVGLDRSNVLYSGGGHVQALLPNTPQTREAITNFQIDLKEWFIREFGVSLGVVLAYVECSASNLAGWGETKSFGDTLQELAVAMSARKAHRYSATDIREMKEQFAENDPSMLECSECQRLYSSDEDGAGKGKCALCGSLGNISRDFVDNGLFVVTSGTPSFSAQATVPLPFGCCLSMRRDEMPANKEGIVRAYAKEGTSVDSPLLISSLWVGDYTYNGRGEGISDYAGESSVLLRTGGASSGIERLGVLRADVDNLGMVFSGGLPMEKSCLARSATMSRALSYFFKVQLNRILNEREYRLQVIYSGGDDLFIIGNWNDVIYAAIDIRRQFREYIGNDAITLSAGIGMFHKKYPIARMAEGTGDLEDAAKLYKSPISGREKDAVALWSEDNVFSWGELVDEIEPLAVQLAEMFRENEKGKSFIYKVLNQLRNFDDAVAAPRLAYLLARSFEDQKGGAVNANKLYGLAMDDRKRRYFAVALEWYVYGIRERG